MGNPFETPPSNEKKRKRFEEATEAEQVERFLNIKSLYSVAKGADPERANYANFFKNVYKYTDKFKMQGMDEKQVAQTFIAAERGNKIINESLNYFLQIKKQQGKITPVLKFDLQRTLDENSGYGFAEEKSGQLNTYKLTELFKWSLNIFIRGGEKIGRKSVLREEEIEPMTEDLESILERVNNAR